MKDPIAKIFEPYRRARLRLRLRRRLWVVEPGSRNLAEVCRSLTEV